MKLFILFLTCFLSFLLINESIQQSNPDIKENILFIINNNISTFFNDDQDLNLLNFVFTQLYNQVPPLNVGKNFTNYMLQNFNSEQQEAFLKFGTKVMAQLGYNGMEAIINKITTVLSDNLVPFMVQIQNNMNSMINLSDDMETIFGEAYKLVLSFATNQEITNVFCAIKNSLTSNEWSVLYPGMNNFALMNLYVDSC